MNDSNYSDCRVRLMFAEREFKAVPREARQWISRVQLTSKTEGALGPPLSIDSGRPHPNRVRVFARTLPTRRSPESGHSCCIRRVGGGGTALRIRKAVIREAASVADPPDMLRAQVGQTGHMAKA